MKTRRSIAAVLATAWLAGWLAAASAPSDTKAPAKAAAAEPAKDGPTAEPKGAPAGETKAPPVTEKGAVTDSAEAAGKAGAPGAKGAAPLNPRFKQVREEIDALFQHRNQPPAPPDPRVNPFRPAGAAPVAATPAAKPAGATPAPLSSDVALLQQAVATLKVGGYIEIAGRAHLVINTKPYRVGEVVQTKVQGESVFLRVRKISRNNVTLGLNAAELTLKF